MRLTKEDLIVPSLGPCRIPSPLAAPTSNVKGMTRFIPEGSGVPVDIVRTPGVEVRADLMLERAGPREAIFFSPAATKAAIVTCGGLCPGLNNVIRTLYHQLHHGYGVRQVLGIPYGYQGMDPKHHLAPMELSTRLVSEIHRSGGSLLGTSRGAVDPAVMVDYLFSLGINVLFCIGGDGTQRGAWRVHEEAQRRGYPLAVVGVPKTIDNDIQFVWRTFGYMTAIDEARGVIDSAHNEARGVRNGVGLVKLMGRESGFIAAGAAVASGEVNLALVPEVPFALEGEQGLFEWLRRRLEQRRHAVIVVAEGAGQELMPPRTLEYDASGNVRFADIGVFLKERIAAWFKERGVPVAVRYIDPSYAIRSRPANCDDALLCDQLARHAAHAAMAGKSGIVVGNWFNVFTHVPTPVAVREKKKIDPHGEAWTSVLAATGQPACLGA
jgi:6-phosphofructokinase 1